MAYEMSKKKNKLRRLAKEVNLLCKDMQDLTDGWIDVANSKHTDDYTLTLFIQEVTEVRDQLNTMYENSKMSVYPPRY
jgi:hypothetical protein